MVDLRAMAAHVQLDALGLLCPMPVIRTQQAVKDLDSGCELEVLATDPGAVHDIQAWCRVHGHAYLEDRRCETGCSAADRAHFHIRLRVCG